MSAKTKESGKFQWFLFVFLIPVLFAIALSFVILNLLNVDVGQQLKNVAGNLPVIKDLAADNAAEESKADESITAKHEEETQKLNQTIEEKNNQLTILESDLKTSREEIDRLNQKIRSMENLEQENNGDTGENGNDQKEKVVPVYESMTGSKAAKILAELDEEDAMNILTQLSSRKLTEVLSQMTPEEAARYTSKLADNEAKGGG